MRWRAGRSVIVRQVGLWSIERRQFLLVREGAFVCAGVAHVRAAPVPARPIRPGDGGGDPHPARPRSPGDHLPDTTGTAPVPSLRELAVEGVSLTYPDRDTPAVDNVSMCVAAGQTVAFVGENGSGKSTLAAMIAGVRVPGSGSITWNGSPLTTLDSEALRGRIAVVTQEYHKWPFTAATNLAIGDVDVDAGPDQARIEAAAARAAAHTMILELPHGYETLLDRTFAHGQDLSGGQWQRITAARGFLRDAELLIMDEPSSALDPRAEEALFPGHPGPAGPGHHDPDHAPAGQCPPRRRHLRAGPRPPDRDRQPRRPGRGRWAVRGTVRHPGRRLPGRTRCTGSASSLIAWSSTGWDRQNPRAHPGTGRDPRGRNAHAGHAESGRWSAAARYCRRMRLERITPKNYEAALALSVRQRADRRELRQVRLPMVTIWARRLPPGRGHYVVSGHLVHVCAD